MKRSYVIILTIIAVALMSACSAKTERKPSGLPNGGPKIGGPAMGGGERQAPSAELQKLIDETVPYFNQYVFVNEKGDSL